MATLDAGNRTSENDLFRDVNGAQLEAMLEGRDLVTVGKRLVGCCSVESLGLCLGLDGEEVTEIEFNFGLEADKRHEILVRWRHKNGSRSATWGRLVRTLQRKPPGPQGQSPGLLLAPGESEACLLAVKSAIVDASTRGKPYYYLTGEGGEKESHAMPFPTTSHLSLTFWPDPNGIAFVQLHVKLPRCISFATTYIR